MCVCEFEVKGGTGEALNIFTHVNDLNQKDLLLPLYHTSGEGEGGEEGGEREERGRGEVM